MSEMVERVAEALFASRRTILPLARWDQLTDAGREQYCIEALAAIDAVINHLYKAADGYKYSEDRMAMFAAAEELEEAKLGVNA